MKKVLLSLIFLVALSVFFTCGLGGGTDTETGIAMISGHLYNLDGSPARGAKVLFIKASNNPYASAKRLAIADSVLTDTNGYYGVDSLPADTYNVYGKGTDGDLSYEDSITVTSDTVIVPPDTLKTPGSLRATIKLQGTDDPRTVFILVMGTSVWTGPDSLGVFNLSDMAEGTYNVRILTTLDNYLVKDTVLSIRSALADTLPSAIELRYTGIPVPAGLQIQYDTLKQIVTLSWNKPVTGRAVAGYNIYRQYMGSTDSSLVKIKSTWTDTVFQDSTGMQDQTYEYRVAAVDTNGTEGTKSAGNIVRIESIFAVTDSIVKGNGNVDGQFGGLVKGVLDNRRNFYITDTKNKWLQKLDSTGSFIFKVDTFSYPEGIAIDSARGDIYISDSYNKTIIKTDTAGNVINILPMVKAPGGMIFYAEKLYVALFGSGIIIYDTKDSLIDSIAYQFNNDNSAAMDFAVNQNGELYVADAANISIVDTATKALSSIYVVNNHDNNQDPNIEFLTENILLLVTRGAKIPFNSTFYLIDRTTGNTLSFWQTPYPVVQILDIKDQGSTIIATTSTGRILYIKKK